MKWPVVTCSAASEHSDAKTISIALKSNKARLYNCWGDKGERGKKYGRRDRKKGEWPEVCTSLCAILGVPWSHVSKSKAQISSNSYSPSLCWNVATMSERTQNTGLYINMKIHFVQTHKPVSVTWSTLSQVLLGKGLGKYLIQMWLFT